MAAGGVVSAQVIGFVLLGFSTVYREGFETVLFLQALELNSGLPVVLEGVALGGLAVMAVAVATFVLERKLPYRKMLIVTGVLLTFVLMVMMGKTVRIMQGVGWVPITPVDIDAPYWAGIWFGVFPTLETLLAQLAGGVFVIGSYLVAERLKRPPPRRSAPFGRQPQAEPHQNGARNGVERPAEPGALERGDRAVDQPRV
jgi:high-affinity iron transporter